MRSLGRPSLAWLLKGYFAEPKGSRQHQTSYNESTSWEANFLPRRPIEKIKSDVNVNENQGRNSCFFGRHSAVYGGGQFGRRPRLE